MAVNLTPLAQSIFEAADQACGPEFQTERQFLESLSQRVPEVTDELEPGMIAAAIVELVSVRRWPWGRS